MTRNNLPSLVLRYGLAFSFLYASISGILFPENWIGYFPPFLLKTFGETFLLYSWALVEMVIALWLIIGKKIFIPSAVATIALLGVVITNTAVFDVVFRDISIAAMSLALALESFPRRKAEQNGLR